LKLKKHHQPTRLVCTKYLISLRPLFVNYTRTPVDDSIVIVDHMGEFEVKRLKLYPTACLQSLDNPEDIRLVEGGDLEGEETIVWGVVTYIINDACTEEFDDCPVM